MKKKSKLIEKMIKRTINNTSKIVYHYMSVSAFRKSLENKELCLTCSNKMNDETEQTFFIRELKDALLKTMSPQTKDNIENFFEETKKKLEGSYPYVYCFSKYDDNAAQWERYADNGKGICVGFNTKKLITLVDSISHMFFTPVYYGYNKKNSSKYISKNILKIENHELYKNLKEYFENGKLGLFENEGEIQASILATTVSYKHRSFITEGEARITALSDIKDECATYEFIEAKDRIQKVLKIDLEKLSKRNKCKINQLIECIIIGPRATQSENELKDYVQSKGLNTLVEKIFKSDCPLRCGE